MAGIGLVAEAFGLSDFEVAAAHVAAAAAAKMKGYRRYGPEDPVPPAKYAKMTGGKYAKTTGSVIPNIVPGGVGHYKGPFKQRKIPVSETASTIYGYKQEQELYGSLNMNDVQYFTVQSVNIQMIARALGMAFARMIMWKHFKMSYTTAGDVLFPKSSDVAVGVPSALTAVFPQLYNIVLQFNNRDSNGVESRTSLPLFPQSVGLGAATTLDDLASNFADLFSKGSYVSSFQGDFREWDGYFFVYRAISAPTASTTVYSYSPTWSIKDLTVSLSVHQNIKIQNTTRADSATAAAGVRDALDANPIVGKSYLMKGIYPDPETTSNYVGDTGGLAWVRKLFNFSTIPHRIGLGVPNANPEAEWRRLPDPQVFSNIICCKTGLRLEPGEIRDDHLGFKFSGVFNDLCRGLSYLDATDTTTTSAAQPTFTPEKMGTCKLYAFEKVVPTGSDRVEINYHIDRVVHCCFHPSWGAVSGRGEFFSNKFDQLLVA